MARNTKDGTESEAAKKLIAEQKATDEAQAARELEVKAEEAAKLKKAQEESNDQTPPVAVAQNAPDKQRKAAWDAFVAKYAEQNPVKYAAKKKAGAFDTIPDSFTGRDQLKITA